MTHLGVRAAPRVDRSAGAARAQRGEHLPGSGRGARLRAPLQLGEALCGAAEGAGPERFDVLEFLPGEEAQVDYGQGALTLYKPGQYKRPYLFVMTLKYSGKSFRKVVWKTNQEIWARLHEEAFRAFGGCPPVRGARQPQGRGDPARPLRPGVEPGVRRDARALRRGGRSVPRRATRIARGRSRARSSTRRARR